MVIYLGCLLLPSDLRSTFNGERISLNNGNAEFNGWAPNAGFLKIECKESRIGKKPVPILKGVTVTLDNQTLTVKGPLGELTQNYPREIKLQHDPSGIITVSRAMETRRAQQMHGLFRSGCFSFLMYNNSI